MTTSSSTPAALRPPKPLDRTVACLIIGDEILNGKTLDTNSNYLAKKLFLVGLRLEKIEVIADDEVTIVDAVRELSAKFGTVITSGGIGPTHDDITYESIAKAFNLDLVVNEPTIEKMKVLGLAQMVKNAIAAKTEPPTEYLITESRLQMARLPTGPGASFIHPSPDLWVPVAIANENVHILPGIPRLFQELCDRLIDDHIVPKVGGIGKGFIRRQIGTRKTEGDISAALKQLQKEADATGVKIGSYPKWQPSDGIYVIVSVVGEDEAEVNKFANFIKAEIEGLDIANE
ncbi:hypothetical protein HK101_008375 [Irineochytrium annulatum]|nr:hypothetical protein HK101_008375 [Irineochytrium annulatum]